MQHELWELFEGEGRVGSKGWVVDHQPGTSVDGHSHHDHQERDFQVSKKGWFITQRNGKRAQRGAKGELTNKAIFMSGVRACIVLMCIAI